MFPRFSIRYIAVLLIPCLVADPLLAVAVSNSSAARNQIVFPQSKFESQALIAPIVIAALIGAGVQHPRREHALLMQGLSARSLTSRKREKDKPSGVPEY